MILDTFGAWQSLLDKLSATASIEEAITLVGFHGTSEPFEGALRPSGYDGVLWTACQPTVAQNYIPISGIRAYVSKPLFLNDRIRPSQHGTWYTLIAKAMGYQAHDIAWNAQGDAQSYCVPAGYPTYADAIEFLRGLGYGVDTWGAALELKTGFVNGVETLFPATYKMPGRLFIIDYTETNIFDYANGRDGDLTDVDYNKLGLFRKLEGAHDGLVINDFCQSKTWGNVGHRSVGLFKKALAKVSYVSIPAANFDWDANSGGLRETVTPEFAAFYRHLKSARLHQIAA